MTERKLFDVMRGIDPQLIASAAPNGKKKKPQLYVWAKIASAAACLALIAVLGISSYGGLSLAPKPQTTAVNEISASDISGKSNFICLKNEDYVPISYAELSDYFGASPTESLPGFALANEDFGIYRTEARGVYYDGNNLTYTSADGEKTVSIGLSKVMKHSSELNIPAGEELKFTEVNNRELAIFRYADEGGNTHFHTEFMQNDVAFSVGAANISAEDFVKCLQGLVEDVQLFGADREHSITGEVIASDPNAEYIVIKRDDGSAYGIMLPDGESTADYSLGDKVKVSFEGEPASALTVYKQQITGIEKLTVN